MSYTDTQKTASQGCISWLNLYIRAIRVQKINRSCHNIFCLATAKINQRADTTKCQPCFFFNLSQKVLSYTLFQISNNQFVIKHRNMLPVDERQHCNQSVLLHTGATTIGYGLPSHCCFQQEQIMLKKNIIKCLHDWNIIPIFDNKKHLSGHCLSS